MFDFSEIFKNFQKETITELIKNYDRLGLRASGKWAKSLSSTIVESTGKTSIKFFAENYSVFLEYGRNKNIDQSKKGLRAWVGWAGSTFLKQWCKDKGINESLSYAIAYKIAKKGINVPNKFNKGGLISDVAEKQTTVLMKTIGYNVKKGIVTTILTKK